MTQLPVVSMLLLKLCASSLYGGGLEDSRLSKAVELVVEMLANA
jgi:hypothetical protein